MSQINGLNEAMIRDVVLEVLGKLPSTSVQTARVPSSKPIKATATQGRYGVFQDPDQAAKAALVAFEQLKTKGWAGRAKVCEIVKTLCWDKAQEWGKIEFDETKIGRLDHKIEKLQGIKGVLGVESLIPLGMSGDNGITMEENAPWGVILAITPVTHSVPTIAGNIINMVAAGNSMVINPHPGGAACAAIAVREFNKAIHAEIGIENLICTIEKPTLESFKALTEAPEIALLCITGGPGVVAAAMKTGKRAICAGPGNPPVVVDDCPVLDFDRVARDIILGGGYDNNLLCIGEKQVFAVGAAFDKLMKSMQRAGSKLVNSGQLDRIRKEVFTFREDDGGCSQAIVNPEFIGADASKLAAVAGVNADSRTELLIAETAADDLFVVKEQMTTFLPIIRCRDFDEAVRMAYESEHGFKHSAMVHTMNVANMTKMAREMDTTIFVKNGPCVAGLGLGGEGYISFSVATATGEGITTPKTFTRFRRCALVDQLNIV
jgi:aldehyde dehydrogenase